MAAVLFDLDGTLIDSLSTVTEAANAVLTARDLPALTAETVAGFVGLGEQVFVDRLIDATRLVAEDRKWIMETFLRHYEVAARDTKVMPGAVQALERLGADGHRLGLVTNKPRGPLGTTLDAAGIARLFDVVVAGDDLPKRKPDPAPLLKAKQALGDGLCIYVGDSEVDAMAAQNAGLPFALYTEGIRTTDIHDMPHDIAFNDFKMLPGIVARLTA